ncbi:MAG TPA: hypothetical protein VGK67_08730 [Myxococcales bacterium]
MRNPTRLLVVVAATLAAGCIPSNSYREYQNHNNGEQAKLTFPMVSALALNETVTLPITRSEEGMYDCADYPLDMDNRAECTFAGTLSPVAEIVEARCEGAGCTVATVGTSAVVTGAAAGTFRLAIQARLADGTLLDDAITLTFARVDSIALSCTETYKCPGPNAVFAGATFHWSFYPSSDQAGPLDGPVAIAGVEPAGIVDAAFTTEPARGTWLTVRALRSGTATLRLTAGGVERRQVVRVVDEGEVVSAKVRTSPSEIAGVASCDADTNVIGAEPPASTDLFPARFVPVWVLGDGTYALGGAGRVRAETAGVEITWPGTPRADDVEIMEFIVGKVECRPGNTRVSARMGAATLDFSYEQLCRN